MNFDRLYFGVDLATKLENSALFVVGESNESLKIVYEPLQHLDARGPAVPALFDQIKSLTARYPADAIFVAIDVPFGYPTEFVKWVSTFDLSKNAKTDLKLLKFRATERFLERHAKANWNAAGVTGLSVAMDKLGVTFTVGADLISRLVTEESFRVSLGQRPQDSKTVVEVYPKASLLSWFKDDTSVVKMYRRSDADRLNLARAVMNKFNASFGTFPLAETQFPTEHAIDAFAAAMTARAYARGECVEPTQTIPPQEGWIWFPDA